MLHLRKYPRVGIYLFWEIPETKAWPYVCIQNSLWVFILCLRRNK